MSKRSLGGRAVESSLESAGYLLEDPKVALVETQRPKCRPFDVVLAQNAWNVIPAHQFETLTAPYPTSMRTRMLARRFLAQYNLRRAHRVVALTASMAEICERSVHRNVEVVPVTLPLVPDVSETETYLDDAVAPLVEETGAFALVPGTVTWYKNPLAAFSYLTATNGPRRVVFAGIDDGSRCRDAVKSGAEKQGYSVRFTTFTPSELRAVYRAAQVVILPSLLESLGFALAEALVHAGRVVASGIPAHQEVARRLQYSMHSPLGETTLYELERLGGPFSPTSLARQWEALGRALCLERRTP